MPEEQLSALSGNYSPVAFHLYATHYYKCKQDFRSPNSFSPVPYFLLCRAIELEIKSRHLKRQTQTEVKEGFGHKLSKAYNALDPKEQVLNQAEVATLEKASSIYAGKGFEYFVQEDALRAHSRYPDLEALDSIAKKLLGI